MHAGGIHALAFSPSTIIRASSANGRGRTDIFSIRSSSGMKQKIPSLLSSPFSFLRQADHYENLLVKFSKLCSQLRTVIATEHQKKQSDSVIRDQDDKAAANEDCTHEFGCGVDDHYCCDENMFEFYAESFSKMLRRVSLADVKMYAELCYLGNLTYHIPKIKEEDLLSCVGLRYVTSHLEIQPRNSHPRENKADKVNEATSQTCGWYICDDDKTGIRYFIIQGSESVASWQANFRFEPVQFEERDVLVHRGVYEVAKGIYEQLLPEVQTHLKSSRNKRRPLLCFTGHSLGGSIAKLLNLMLLIRAEAPISALLPVVTYCAPYVMCGGEDLMMDLGLPKDHIQGIVLHRDIVPRSLSVTLPGWLIDIVKAVNVNLQINPCLNMKGLVYAPMGEFLILQPKESFSPSHHLLPPGPGLYLLTCTLPDTLKAERMLRAAQRAFLDYPYPIDILKDPSAYGGEGTIVRDHDMNSYLKCLHDLIKYEETQIEEMRSKRPNRFWWTPLPLQQMKTSEDNRDTVWQPKASAKKYYQEKQLKLKHMFETTTESMKGPLAILNLYR